MTYIICAVILAITFVGIVTALMWLCHCVDNAWYDAARALYYLAIAIVTTLQFFLPVDTHKTLSLLVVSVSLLEFLANAGVARKRFKKKGDKNTVKK